MKPGVLLNGLQTRTQATRLEKNLADERDNVKQGERRWVQVKIVEDELREDIDEMMEALDRSDKFKDPYNPLVGEVFQLGLSDECPTNFRKRMKHP
ncbi:unnamed protein product [Rhizoctonia solani]|uniref:Uncharacterized protein n=1 Tax=Rhizoctonia solani TaxID=456999 RepID=A0A8H3B7N7_9AGAM|nr:unnamed protein product [Rhizoctonia solani]